MIGESGCDRRNLLTNFLFGYFDNYKPKFTEIGEIKSIRDDQN